MEGVSSVRELGRTGGVFSLYHRAEAAMVLGALLIVLQAADGILTSVGVIRFGVAIEGNPLLRTLMEQFGYLPSLAVVKLLAVIIIIGLTLHAKKAPWLKSALSAISCIYFFAAILPWTYLLFLKQTL